MSCACRDTRSQRFAKTLPGIPGARERKEHTSLVIAPVVAILEVCDGRVVGHLGVFDDMESAEEHAATLVEQLVK